jgi:hypothetical protein
MSITSPSLIGMVAQTRQADATRQLAHRQLLAAARTPRTVRLGLVARLGLARALTLGDGRRARTRRATGSAAQAACCA